MWVFVSYIHSEQGVKEAGISFQHFSNSYILKDEYCLCLTSDATVMALFKCRMYLALLC